MAVAVNPDCVPDDLECSICLSLPTEPRILKYCSHVFCKACIEKSLSQCKECPMCKQSCQERHILPLETIVVAHRIWSKIAVKCEHHEDGCNWNGSVADYHAHAQTCPIEVLCKRIDI